MPSIKYPKERARDSAGSKRAMRLQERAESDARQANADKASALLIISSGQ